MTFSTEQILAFASLLGALAVIWGVISKPIKAVRDLQDSVTKLADKVDEIKEVQDMQGDMVYQLLDHAASNNNTGGMHQALQRYNEFYRH